MRKIARKPPSGAPEGTVWFGGPVDSFVITLRITGDFDPDQITSLLQCAPTRTETKGKVIHTPGGPRTPKKGVWSLRIESNGCPEGDLENGIKTLLDSVSDDPEVWATLNSTYSIDLFCGLFLDAHNRGFSLSDKVSGMLSARRLEIGFDIYFG